MASAERSKSPRSNSAPANHMSKSAASGHDCTVSWNHLPLPPGGGGLTGGIYPAGGRSSGADHHEKSGLRSAVRRRSAVTQGAKVGPKLRDLRAAVPPVANWHGSSWYGRGDLNSHVLSDNRF